MHMMETFQGIELRPELETPKQLYVLLHGLGSRASNLLPFAKRLQADYPDAAFLIPDAPDEFDGGGYEWYSIRSLTEENRPARVVRAVPFIHALVQQAQERLKVLPTDTALVGFSQGASVALEYCSAHDGSVGRVLAFSGRYATLPDKAPELITIHLLHGKEDRVIPVEHAYTAYERLASLHGDVTIDIASSVGHEMHDALVERAIYRLQTCVPLRSWERALGINRTQ
jgi:phospholipase/carboxylesterase